jgi:hypothetical protein
LAACPKFTKPIRNSQPGFRPSTVNDKPEITLLEKLGHPSEMARASWTPSALRPRLRIAAVIVVLVSVSGAVLLGLIGSPETTLTQPARAARTAIPNAVPRSSVPIAEPLVFAPIAAARARQLNAAVPFAASVGRAARPFNYSGGTEGRQRAIDCLASAMWYEAGDDPAGQRAVGQVVLNRVRHPAFPPSVCGVVFQGSERETGCQFTFTCDGAMQRTPSEAGLARARSQAKAMLEGKVYPDVGLSTHYHTDWVHPVWSAEMVKLAQVDTHLFFRWRGSWGAPPAARRYGGVEPAIAALSRISPIHAATASNIEQVPDSEGAGQSVAHAFAIPGAPAGTGLAQRAIQAIELAVTSGGNGSVAALAALDRCDSKPSCKVVGRLSPSSEPVFLYVRDHRARVDRAFWDCAVFARKDTAQCFSPANLSWLHFGGDGRIGA